MSAMLPGALAVIFRTIALCGIRQNLHTVGMGDFHNFVIVGRVAENINRNNGLQIQFALFLNIGDCFFQIFRIHIERIGVGVDENRRSATMATHSAEATNVKEETNTASPALTSQAIRASVSASVPEPQVEQYFVPE